MEEKLKLIRYQGSQAICETIWKVGKFVEVACSDYSGVNMWSIGQYTMVQKLAQH